MPKTMIDKHGEVAELYEDFFARAKRGRPAMPATAKKQRVNLMLDPDVVLRLQETPNMSALVNKVLRQKLIEKRAAKRR